MDGEKEQTEKERKQGNSNKLSKNAKNEEYQIKSIGIS